ncbi:MAG: thymidylate synthase [Candidatus Zambryskibacteria bacterium]|nr:thymidylate synthase [Candidatus Zambryskibacteria bacterium]
MRFEALYYKERLTVINPSGDVAVVTLWSLTDSAVKILEAAGIDLTPETSRVAVISNLYGNGLPHMLRALLWNPQIQHIVVFGSNLSGSKEWLVNFFEHGLENFEFLGSPAFRIRNTDRVIDGEVQLSYFLHPPSITTFGKLTDSETQSCLQEFFAGLPGFVERKFERVAPPQVPEPQVTRFPSDPSAHMIVRGTPMEAWAELVFRLYRFGYRNKVAKKGALEERVELLDMKVVINNPVEESAEILGQYGFELEKFRGYQLRILDPVKPHGLQYSYGNLLRGHFQYQGEIVDSLAVVARRLKVDPHSRHEYVALWDNGPHLVTGRGCPCFVSAFFRFFEGKLHMTATFRTHNAMDAWPENLYGLIAILRFVAEHAGMETGSITVFSHSISIDPSALEKAKKIAEGKKTDDIVNPETAKVELRLDPGGEYTVTFDSETFELVVEHSFGGMKLGEYRGKTAEQIEQQLACDGSILLISHALYVGRQLARKEIEMKAARLKK